MNGTNLVSAAPDLIYPTTATCVANRLSTYRILIDRLACNHLLVSVSLATITLWLFSLEGIAQTTVHVRDDFSTQSFSNNDGPDNWAADWVEVDPELGGAGPATGQVRVSGGFLVLDDYPDTGGIPSARRHVDVQGAGVVWLRYDWSTSSGVDSDDAITVAVSSDGGASWNTLEVITGITGAVTQSRVFDITVYAAANTGIRFSVSNKYGASNESFSLDYIEVETATGSSGCNNFRYLDSFTDSSYSNNDGAQTWIGDWIENDPLVGGAGPGAGHVSVFDNALRLFDNPDTGGFPSADRGAYLEDATSATLNFDFRTTAGVDISDAVAVEVSPDNGVSWELLETITGIAGAESMSRSLNITDSATAMTRVRFRISGLYGGSDEFFFADNVEVTGVCVLPVTLMKFEVE